MLGEGRREDWFLDCKLRHPTQVRPQEWRTEQGLGRGAGRGEVPYILLPYK